MAKKKEMGYLEGIDVQVARARLSQSYSDVMNATAKLMADCIAIGRSETPEQSKKQIKAYKALLKK